MLAEDKHTSLLRTFVNYGRKKFYNIGDLNDVVAVHFDEPLTVVIGVVRVGVVGGVDGTSGRRYKTFFSSAEIS